jgi:fatty acid desaturase
VDTPPAGWESFCVLLLRSSYQSESFVNGVLLFVALAIALVQFFLAPLLVAVTPASALALVCLCAVTTPLHWGLMHESIHGHLFRNPSANRRAGRVLGSFLCLSWDVMRFGHLLHHSNNRHEFDRPEAVPAGGTRLGAAGPYFLKLLGGHAVVSAMLSLALVLPSGAVARLIPKAEPMHKAALRAFTNKERQARIRGDLCATAVLLGLAVLCWRAEWPILAATIGARFLILSLLDNAPHYGTALDSGTYARNTRLPGWAQWLVMGHNFHGVHHAATGLSWQELREAFERTGGDCEGSWTRMVLRQFQGPVYLD